jgi:Tfp pilus assembly protein FimT
MMELVFVIVVLGILASLALPRMDRDLRQEAKDNILAAIRYTQHLALNDDKTDPTDTDWQEKLWKISFTTSTDNLENFYTVSSDADQDGFVDKNETAIDPANGKYMFNTSGATVGIDSDESPNVFIGKTYGVNSITFSDACNDAKHIAFDHLGRPHNDVGYADNDYDEYMDADCTIQFGFADTSITPLIVTIKTETGHVSAN